MKYERHRGFTLLELLFTAAVFALLMTLCVPAYQHHVLRQNRALARQALAALAVQQEAYALRHQAHAKNIAELLDDSRFTGNHFFLSRDGRKFDSTSRASGSLYKIELLDNGATSFTLSATATGAQTADKSCQSLTLNSMGQRTASAFDGKDSTAECWR